MSKVGVISQKKKFLAYQKLKSCLFWPFFRPQKNSTCKISPRKPFLAPISIFLGEFYCFSPFLKVWDPKKIFRGVLIWVSLCLFGSLFRDPKTGISRVNSTQTVKTKRKCIVSTQKCCQKVWKRSKKAKKCGPLAPPPPSMFWVYLLNQGPYRTPEH